MSADNAIAILITHDRFWKDSPDSWTTMGKTGQDVWRVAHIQNPESFDDYRHREIHNLGWWMDQTFSKAPAFQTGQEAMEAAKAMEKAIGYVEYGIIEYDARPRNFPGH
jgi:hypothetical protein